MNCAMTEDERLFEQYSLSGYTLAFSGSSVDSVDIHLEEGAESDNRDNCGAKDRHN